MFRSKGRKQACLLSDCTFVTVSDGLWGWTTTAQVAAPAKSMRVQVVQGVGRLVQACHLCCRHGETPVLKFGMIQAAYEWGDHATGNMIDKGLGPTLSTVWYSDQTTGDCSCITTEVDCAVSCYWCGRGLVEALASILMYCTRLSSPMATL